MYSLELDTRPVIRFNDANSKAAASFAQDAYERLVEVVAKERTEHKFKNRTHAAEQSMEVRGRPVGEDVDCDVVFGVHYASYLEKRGFSRFGRLTERAFAAVALRAVPKLLKTAEG